MRLSPGRQIVIINSAYLEMILILAANYYSMADLGQKGQQKKWLKAVLGVVSALVLLAVGVFVWFFKTAYQQERAAGSGLNASSTLNLISEVAQSPTSPSLGNPQAKLVIVEFGDFQCEYCRAEFPVIRQFVTEHQQEVFFLFRNYISLDQNSVALTQAALCANEQGKFWAFHDRLFSNEQGGQILDDFISQQARAAGLNLENFAACRQAGRYQDQINQDIADATLLGIKGTPTFFINGYKLAGVVTQDQWRQILAKVKEAIKK